MNARDDILKAISRTDTEPSSVPEIAIEPIEFNDTLETFKASLATAGGEAVETDEYLDTALKNSFENIKVIYDTRKDTPSTDNLESVDLAVIEGEFAVAENGAVWVDPKERYPRALLTLAKNIAVILPKNEVVPTMHQAYERADIDAVSYALFLSGPSKTADIEQSLVIGAHGAIGLKVFLV